MNFTELNILAIKINNFYYNLPIMFDKMILDFTQYKSKVFLKYNHMKICFISKYTFLKQRHIIKHNCHFYTIFIKFIILFYRNGFLLLLDIMSFHSLTSFIAKMLTYSDITYKRINLSEYIHFYLFFFFSVFPSLPSSCTFFT